MIYRSLWQTVAKDITSLFWVNHVTRHHKLHAMIAGANLKQPGLPRMTAKVGHVRTEVRRFKAGLDYLTLGGHLAVGLLSVNFIFASWANQDVTNYSVKRSD